MAQTTKIVIGITDAKNKTSRMLFHVPHADPYTVPDINSDPVRTATLIAHKLTGIIYGYISSISVVYNVPLVDMFGDPLPQTPATEADVEEGAVFKFKTANGYPVTMRIPTYDEWSLTANGDFSPASFADQWANMVLDMSTFAPLHNLDLCDSRGDDITIFLGGGESFKRS